MSAFNEYRLRSKEAAAYLGISPSTLAKWRMRGEGPPFERCGPRLVVYRLEAIRAWLEERRNREPGAAPSVGRAPR